MESSTLTTKGQLLVPKRLRIKYGIQPGKRIALVESKQGILLRPMDESFIDQFVGKYKNSAPSSKEVKTWKKTDKKLEDRPVKRKHQ
ncbi:MAG: AbrB/MazE/SpoVT family DNA-binding domain-containing protein [Saprospiraceae bacterium]